MTRNKVTKKALVASLFSLLLCFSMLLGTTFAWFTDSVTSSGNIIQSGTLKVGMYWADGTEDPAKADYNNAAEGQIFKYDNWEPGYAEVRHIKITNEGTLALKYEIRILPNGVVSELADVIDVYFVDPGVQVENRAALTEENKVGVLSDVLAAMPGNTSGTLEAGKEVIVTIALKMQESAGNEYQGLSIGSDFSVQLLATQMTAEGDSFDDQYDANAGFDTQDTPAASVTALKGNELVINYTQGIGGNSVGGTLDTGYQFEPTETLEQAEASEYRYYHADFVIKADKDVAANSIMLAGYYKEWCQYNNDNWVGMTSDNPITAGTEVRLVEALGATVNYEELCKFGNDGLGFLCGAKDMDGTNVGTTITVELRLYETEAPSEANGNSKNIETGNYIVIGTFTYTF